MSSPTTQLFLPPQLSMAKGSKSTVDTRIRKSAKTTKARWIVNTAKPVPVFGLDRGSEEVYFDARIVATRIDHSLRVRSVEVKFDSEHAEAICKTSNRLGYKICLFTSDNGASTHVEVIRIYGCGFAFRREREAIVNAANGLGAATSSLSPPKLMTIPAELKSLYKPPSKSDLESTLFRASDSFHSNNRHCILFTLENLAAITDAQKAHDETAHLMSELIMQNICNILDLILAIYCMRSKSDDSISENIRQSCLTILLHVFQNVSTKRSGFLDQSHEEFAEKLIPYLVQDVRECERNGTNNACLALKCLRLVLVNSSLACQFSKEYNLRDVLMQAKDYGSHEYFNLEKIANSTIEVLA